MHVVTVTVTVTVTVILYRHNRPLHGVVELFGDVVLAEVVLEGEVELELVQELLVAVAASMQGGNEARYFLNSGFKVIKYYYWTCKFGGPEGTNETFCRKTVMICTCRKRSSVFV